MIGSVPGSSTHATQLERTTHSVLEELTQTGRAPQLLQQPHATEILFIIASNEYVELLPPLRSISSYRNATEDWPLIIIHSSGSTKFPKPIRINQQSGLEWFTAFWRGDVDFAGKVVGVMVVPAFHVTGFCMELGTPLTSELCLTIESIRRSLKG